MGVVVIHAHPYPRRSRAGRALLRALDGMGELEVRSLYDHYPDFAIDVAAEQNALRRASAIVWQAPFYWYGLPALFSLWFEKVLVEGFAYGPGGDALCGKPLLWATTTGTARSAYAPDAMHHHAFADFVPPIEQTARFCGLAWQEPFVLHDAHDVSKEELEACARKYRERVEGLAS